MVGVINRWTWSSLFLPLLYLLIYSFAKFNVVLYTTFYIHPTPLDNTALILTSNPSSNFFLAVSPS